MGIGFGAVESPSNPVRKHRYIPQPLVGEPLAIQQGQPESHGIND